MTGDASIVIRVRLGDGEPPTGTVDAGEDRAVPFAGWLELLHVISRVASGRPAADLPSTASAEADVVKGSER